MNHLISGGLRKPKLQILGCDVAGQVEAVGYNVKQFQPGDAVFGDLSAVSVAYTHCNHWHVDV